MSIELDDRYQIEAYKEIKNSIKEIGKILEEKEHDKREKLCLN